MEADGGCGTARGGASAGQPPAPLGLGVGRLWAGVRDLRQNRCRGTPRSAAASGTVSTTVSSSWHIRNACDFEIRSSPQGVDQLVDLSRRYPVDVGLLNDGPQRLFGPAPRLQQGRVVAAGPHPPVRSCPPVYPSSGSGSRCDIASAPSVRSWPLGPDQLNAGASTRTPSRNTSPSCSCINLPTNAGTLAIRHLPSVCRVWTPPKVQAFSEASPPGSASCGSPRQRSIHLVKGPDRGKNSSAADGDPYFRAPATTTCTYDDRTSPPIPTSPPVSVRTDRGVTVPARGSDGCARRTRRPANPRTC